MPAPRWCILVVVAAALAGSLHADQHPMTARGFDIGRPYQMNGIDNINLFNGNLTVTIPIGQRYHVNGKLGYGLTLVYSGNLWDSVEQSPPSCGVTLRTYPNRLSNAGIGWLLSLGRLFPPNQAPLLENLDWTYESPDGGLHPFRSVLHSLSDSVDSAHQYTRDGSYLRMTINASDRTIELPDGTSQVFKEMNPTANGAWTPLPGNGHWRLNSMTDRFGNSVTIVYSSLPATGSDPAYSEIWTIADGTRTQQVFFVAPPAGSFYDAVLDHVVLTTFGSSTAEWRPAYAYVSLAAGRNNGTCNSIYTNTPLMTSFTLPAVSGVSQMYSMLAPNGTPYYFMETACQGNPSTTCAFNGHLKGLQLPTKGWLEWDYENFQFLTGSEEGARPARSIAVTARRMLDPDRGPSPSPPTWHYSRQVSARRSCYDPNAQLSYTAHPDQLVASVTSPENVTTVRYFSTYDLLSEPTACNAGTSPFGVLDYALPFGGQSQTIGSATLHLSQETFNSPPASLATGPSNWRINAGAPVRSEWVAYAADDDSIQPAFNPRETRHTTYFDDDSSCSAVCYASVSRYGFDGAGEFQQSSTGGNFGGGNFKTTFTNYPNVNLTGNWVLGTFTERCVTEETVERTAVVAGCSSLPSPFTEQFSFDSRGFLTCRRTLKDGATRGVNDVIATFADTAGNITLENYYGGDDSGVGLGDCSTAIPSSPTYSLVHEYSNGALARSHYQPTTLRPLSASPIVYSVDNTIDASTGLVSASRDTTGRETSYSYDKLGRLVQVNRPGEVPINYTYAEATATTLAQATAAQTSSAAGTVQSATIFDGFGRIFEEQRLMPAGTARRRTLYTPSGWTSQISEWEATPSHFTVFRNFDAFGRAGTITAPDSSVTTIAYQGVHAVARTVSVGTALGSQTSQTTTETYDRLGRLVTVAEPGGISSTAYTYDAADRLRSVSMTAGVTQPRTFTYDGRGFLTQETHPENGTTSYGGFDARGHVGRKDAGAAASPFDLRYEYDGAERLTRVSHPATRTTATGDAATVKSFAFAADNDGSNYKKGKLETAMRRNESPVGTIDVSEVYAYIDVAGRLTNKTTSITGPNGLSQSYAQSYTYNDLSLLSQTNYPTCVPASNCATSAAMINTLTPTYQNGLIQSIPNFGNNVSYDLNGMVNRIDHPGSISDLITVDPTGMPRPTRIQFNSYDLCTPPSITQQPLDQQISSGGSTTLSVTAAAGSTTPLTYQWFKDNATDPMANETTSTCCAGGITATGRYKVRIINSCGKVDSNTATVNVCGAPAISSQPQGASIASGGNATLSVSANGCSPLGYQWYRGASGDTSTPLPGANTSSFNTGALSVTTSYWARVTDGSGGPANSATGTVTVCSAPAIATQPQSAVYNGTPITLSVTANGCAPFSYQWYRGDSGDTTTLVGTAQSYAVPAPAATTKYWVRVTDTVNATVNSSAATITLSCADPTITTQPQDGTYTGAPITLTVAASGGCPPYAYQWYRGVNGTITNPQGSNAPSFSVPDVSNPSGTAYFWVKVTGTGGGQANSNTATISCMAPTASVQPSNATYTGTPVTLTATPTGCGPFTYQWYAGFSGDQSSPLVGSVSASYTTPSLTASARYWVWVHDVNGNQVSSGTAVVNVPLPTPGALVATLTNASQNQITVSWGRSAGAHHYELQSLAGGSWTTTSVTPPNPNDPAVSTVLNNLSSSTTYVYRVRAVDVYGGSQSAYTVPELATTMTFTAIQANVTRIAFSHVDEVRTAVNAVRWANHDPALSWREVLDQGGYPNVTEPGSNVGIRAAHVLALRKAMDRALSAVQVPTQGYTDALTSPTLIKAVHITQLQQRAQ